MIRGGVKGSAEDGDEKGQSMIDVIDCDRVILPANCVNLTANLATLPVGV